MFLLALGLGMCSAANAQNNEWTWVSGSSVGPGIPVADTGYDDCGQAGVYGVLGKAALTNVPGGRSSVANWRASNGSLWIFGGMGVDLLGIPNELNDFWQFNPSTHTWTWMAGTGSPGNLHGVYGKLGVAAAGNLPGGREAAVSWTDKKGNFWLFGGGGADATGIGGYLNDLWEFSPGTNEWTWMGGSKTVPNRTGYGGQPGVYGTLGTPSSANVPGSRLYATGWSDHEGNLWLFGGIGYDFTGALGELNDLWEFNPTTRQWTWAAGPDTIGPNGGQPGEYGRLGLSAPGNTPGGRDSAMSWTDSNGNLWLFGGEGFDGSGTTKYPFPRLNDLWVFNVLTREWTWMSGGSLAGAGGIAGKYDTPGSGSGQAFPGGRESGAAWMDESGNLWLFGGQGLDESNAPGLLNDLWEYNPQNGVWSWMGGSSTVGVNGGQPGVYEELGSPSPTSLPGGRTLAASWIDVTGNFWLFGGSGMDGTGTDGCLNDLWEYKRSAYAAPAAPPSFSVEPGTYTSIQTVALADVIPGAAIYYTLNGTAPTTASQRYSTAITVSTSKTIRAIAVATGFSPSPIASATYTLQTATPVFSPNPGIYASSETVQLTDATPRAVIYYTTNGKTPTTSSTEYSKGIPVAASADIQAIAVAPEFAASPIAAASYRIGAAAATPAPNQWMWMSGSSTEGTNCTTIPGGGSICGQAGTYGFLSVPSPADLPGGRDSGVSWTDSAGNLWIFGGIGFNPIFLYGETNELWEFSPSSNEWTWVSGGNPITTNGLYGLIGSPGQANVPGVREGAAGFRDHEGRLWLFGGSGENTTDHWGYLNDLWMFDPAIGEWTWMSGSSGFQCATVDGYYLCGEPGNYGTRGAPGAANVPAGREYPASWTDGGGNLWLFGGGTFGYFSPDEVYLNDLWEFNLTTGVWTWISGSSSLGTGYSEPGVYGTEGKAAASNTPGSRCQAMSWTGSSGDLWLFGGFGADANNAWGWLNDLWRFNPSTREWTWIGGSSTLPSPGSGRPGVYGMSGTAAAGNAPGGRQGGAAWTDASGNLWLMGGYGFDSAGTQGYLSDLWEYNASTSEWAWMNGSDLAGKCTADGTDTYCGQNGVYGTSGIPASANSPGGRSNAAAWTDRSGNLWLFGGFGVDSSGTWGELNDLWAYQISAFSFSTATPAFSVAPGIYPSAVTVSLSDATPGAVIYYTTNGTTPTPASPQYSQPISVLSSKTVEAIAVAPNYLASAVGIGAYTIASAPASSTTLTVTTAGKTVTAIEQGTPVTLTAVVKSHGVVLTSGEVNFCESTSRSCTDNHLFGTAQLTPAGSAVLRFTPSVGAHSIKAVFTGILGQDAASSSAAAALKVTGGKYVTATSIASTRSGSDYTLTATVTSPAAEPSLGAPSGTVSFVDTSDKNAVLGSAALSGGVSSLTWVNSESPATGEAPTPAVVADFNGDGIADLAIANENDGTITILLGNGDGTFRPAPAATQPGSSAAALATGDFNGDGIPDLAVSVGFNTIILLGKGDGTFTVAPNSLAVRGLMVVADFNGDGIADIAVLGSVVTILQGVGNGTFTQLATTSGVCGGADAITAGDFNGDGKTDLAIACRLGGYEGGVTVLLGKGDGTFTGAPELDGGWEPTGIVAGDFNGDGKLDLALAGAAGITVEVGNGDGTFKKTSGLALAPNLSALTEGDFNGDGIPDLAGANYSDGTTWVMLGNGNGAFTYAGGFASATLYPGMVSGDFNGDGISDIVVLDPANDLAQVELAQPKVTASASINGVSPALAGPDAVVARYEGDTHYFPSQSSPIPLYKKRPQPQATSTVLQLTAGSSTVTSVPAGTPVAFTATVKSGVTPLTVGQVNFCDATAAHCTDVHLLGTAQLTSAGTAVLRMVPAPGNHQYKAIFAGTSTNAVSASAVHPLAVGGKARTVTVIAQSGNPGDYTLTATVAGSAGKAGTAAPTGSVAFLDTSNGNASLGSAPLIVNNPAVGWFNSQSPTLGESPVVVAVADFNGDGIPDIAVGYGNDTKLTILLGNGDGTFGAAPASIPEDNYTGFIAVGDFNHDGIPDLAVLPSSGDDGTPESLQILLGNGDGTFRAAPSLAVSQDAESLVVADFNGDGVEDLAITNPAETSLTILLGNGDGTFTQVAQSPATGSGPWAVAAGDFNGDGIMDLAVADSYETVLTILLGNGDGTFRSAPNASTGSAPYALVTGDFNGDGILDLAVANARSDAVTILLGKGDGTFKAAASPSTSSEASSIAIGDFNGDGKADLVLTNPYSDSLTVLLGNGNGTFTPAQAPSPGVNPFFVATGDFNGDGISDIAVANFTNPGPYGPVTVLLAREAQATATLKGVAPREPGTHGAVASYGGNTTYEGSDSAPTGLSAAAAAPTFSPPQGSYSAAQKVAIHDATPGATIYYAINGAPTTSSTKYTGPVTVSATETIEAFATAPGYIASSVVTATYKIP